MRLRLRLVHGDARFTRWPVLLGHYEGDTLVSAESHLDERLRAPGGREGPLRQLHRLGLYPGAPGTQRVVSALPGCTPPAVVVIGLGEVGLLTPSGLRESARAAWLDTVRQGQASDGVVAALMVGTGDGQLRASESIDALVQAALDANAALARAGQAERLAELVLLELFEDAALGAAQALHGLLQQAPWARQVRWAPAAIESGEGRRKRRRIQGDPAWWQRWVVEQVHADGEARLRFVALGERARAEVSSPSGQLALTDDFVARSAAQVRADPALTHTLAELLLPLRLREAPPEPRDRLLLLDVAAARFPWEMLPGHDGTPLAVQRPLMRQLRTERFRATPRHAPDDALLVIGHPDLGEGSRRSDLPELPGARAEAQAVAALARRAKLPHTAAIDAPAVEVVQALHARPWRLLHLSGHGVVGARTGLAIGPRRVLSAGDVAQLRCVPEFVFVNACHQGSLAPEGAPQRAAGLAAAFIEMGARVVVCAGWAVDDTAATTFARALYRALFAGRPVAEALLLARRACWQRHPGSNTWGAYQAYGDPAWCLDRHDPKAPATARAPRTEALPFFLPQELRTELENLSEATKVRVSRGEDPGLRGRLRGLLRRAPRSWRDRGDLCAAIGQAYSDAGVAPKALLWWVRALRAPDGDAPLRCAEQAAHLALQTWLEGRSFSAATRAEAVATLKAWQRRAPTPERARLLRAVARRAARPTGKAPRGGGHPTTAKRR